MSVFKISEVFVFKWFLFDVDLLGGVIKKEQIWNEKSEGNYNSVYFYKRTRKSYSIYIEQHPVNLKKVGPPLNCEHYQDSSALTWV